MPSSYHQLRSRLTQDMIVRFDMTPHQAEQAIATVQPDLPGVLGLELPTEILSRWAFDRWLEIQLA